MTSILTGMNGTVAPCLAAVLEQHGHRVVAWDRALVPPDEPAAMEAFLDDVAPDWFFHVGMGSPEWAADLARLCRDRKTRFLYTSSVSVFSGEGESPISPDRQPDATDEYGRYKAESEARIREANPDARIARLAWQIGSDPETNNMARYFTEQAGEDGVVAASSRCFPAACFLEDTAIVLHEVMANHPPGTYHIDGNEGLSLYEIGCRLATLLSAPWTISESTEYVFDNRMSDSRLRVPPLSARLP